MKSRINPLFRSSSLTLIAITIGALPILAGTTWDGGGGADTSINLAANWNLDTVNALDGTTAAIFGTGGSTATMNVDAFFTGITFNRAAAFTLNADTGKKLVVRSVNSGGSTNISVTSAAGGTQTIDAPLEIDTNNVDTNKLFSFNNSSPTRILDINGNVSRSAASNTDFQMRIAGVAGSVTRFDGQISNLTIVQQSASTWAGDLIFGGSKNPGSAINIAATTSGILAPLSTARLFLGESPSDVQSWGNITLNNTIKLVIGGNITAGTITNAGNATAATTLIVGNSATDSTLSLTGGTFTSNVALGGNGTNENNLSIVKRSAATTLNIDSTTATYTGATTVEAGTLNISASLASPIIVQAGATLGGEGSTSSSLTFGAGNSTFSYNPTTGGAFSAGSVDLSAAGLVTLSPSSSTTTNTAYVALKRSSGTFTEADRSKFVAATRSTITRTDSDQEITVTPTGAASLVWAGNTANPTFWDVTTTQNWKDSGGSADRFYAGDAVTFNDTASSFTVAVQGSSISPGNLVFENSANDYTVSGGGIAGTGSLTKKGSGILTLTQITSASPAVTTTNTFSGPLNLEEGTLSISHLNQIGGGSSTRAITLKGGALRYTGATMTTDTMPVTLSEGTSSTIDIATATNQTLRFGSALTGSGNLIKKGNGILALGKNVEAGTTGSTFTGTVTVDAGELDIRNPDALGATSSGTTINHGATLSLFVFNLPSVTFNSEPIAFSGTSYLRNKNQDTTRDITHTLTGPVTLNASAQTGFSSPKANSTSAFVSKLKLTGGVSTGAESILDLGRSIDGGAEANKQEIEINAVSGSGAVRARGLTGSLYSITTPSYSGDTTVNGGTLILSAGNPNNHSSTVTVATTNGATLQLDFEGTDTVNKLFIGGVQQAAGVYKAEGSASTGTALAQITGTGTLTVTAGPASGYSTWADLYAAGQTVNQDHDLDGVPNGVEYFMGATGSTFTANPGVVEGKVTWPMGASYAGVYGTDYQIQTSFDLSTWTNVPSTSLTITPGTSVSYTLPTGSGKQFTRLQVNPN